MIKVSYSKNYLKSFFWQFSSLVSGILSLIIVTPLLSKSPSIYGMYTLTISFSFFLSYADIGFVSAAIKYVSEAFAKSDRKEEVRLEGFVSFILTCFILLFSLVILYLSFHPGLIVKDLNNESERLIISKLLLVQAIFAPNFILLRLLEIIFGARLEQFYLHRIMSAVSLVKILCVNFFINNTTYNIVGYYLLSQILTLSGLIVAFLIAKKNYSINAMDLLRNIRFNREAFRKTKKIAVNSLYITIVWMLFFEIDNVLIAKLLGSEDIAFYMIGFTVISFFRSFFSIIYGPFQSRFNHFIGLNDTAGLKKLYNDVLALSMPLIVLSIASFVILARPLILSWVGNTYESSILVAELLVAGYVVTFITQPTGIILIAEERVKWIYWTSTLTAVVFYTVLWITLKNLGLVAFSIAKLAGFLVAGTLYAVPAIRRYDLSPQMFKNFLPALLFHIIFCFLIRDVLPVHKSGLNTLLVAATGLVVSLISLLLFYLTSGKFKELIHFKFAEIGFKKNI